MKKYMERQKCPKRGSIPPSENDGVTFIRNEYTTWSRRYIHKTKLFFKNGQFRPLFRLFSVFKTNNTILTTNECLKCHVHPVYGAGIRTHALQSVSLLYNQQISAPYQPKTDLSVALLRCTLTSYFATLYYRCERYLGRSGMKAIQYLPNFQLNLVIDLHALCIFFGIS